VNDASQEGATQGGLGICRGTRGGEPAWFAAHAYEDALRLGGAARRLNQRPGAISIRLFNTIGAVRTMQAQVMSTDAQRLAGRPAARLPGCPKESTVRRFRSIMKAPDSRR
jgi:hypothetical protein